MCQDANMPGGEWGGEEGAEVKRVRDHPHVLQAGGGSSLSESQVASDTYQGTADIDPCACRACGRACPRWKAG